MARLAFTDGGVETSLIFHGGFDLPCFAAFPLLETESGREGLRRYYEPFLAIADSAGLPFVLDTPTWRASPDWGERLGYDRERLARANEGAVRFGRELAGDRAQIMVSGLLGPRGDGYVVGERMTSDAAQAYHEWQVGVLAAAGAERITALTLTYPEEAIGIVQAATAAGLPAVVSFTVETDGRLPSGDGLAESVARVDAETDAAAAFFMVNCAHPSHFARVVDDGGGWLERIGGIRPNASALSHAELDASDDLDEGDPAALAGECAALCERLPAVELIGGCCGTDQRHVGAMIAALTA